MKFVGENEPWLPQIKQVSTRRGNAPVLTPTGTFDLVTPKLKQEKSTQIFL
jgi:hypothetical protein